MPKPTTLLLAAALAASTPPALAQTQTQTQAQTQAQAQTQPPTPPAAEIAPAFTPLTADQLPAALDALIDGHPTAHRTTVTLVVRDLDTGQTLYDRGGDKLLTPASNLKIYTAAAAIDLLGPDYTWTTGLQTVPFGGTDVRHPATTVYLHATGDPMFDDAQLREMVKELVLVATIQEPIRNVQLTTPPGWVELPLKGPGWMWDDDPDYYNMSIRGGMLNFNVVDVHVDPDGDPSNYPPSPTMAEQLVGTDHPVRVRAYNQPTSEYPGFTFGSAKDADANGWVGPSADSNIRITREPFSDDWLIRGNIKPDDETAVFESLSVHDPARWMASVLADMLADEGLSVQVDGNARYALKELTRPSTADRDAKRNANNTIERPGKPLSQAVQHFLRVSENAVGEMLLLHLAEKFGDEVSWPAGAKVISDWLVNVAGLDEGSFRLVDGSGLSRYNLISANSSIQLLDYVDDHAHFDVFHEGLPTYDIDFPEGGQWRGVPLLEFDAQRVHAKPGGMSGVNTISGYLTTLDGKRLAFSLLANGYLGSSAPARDLRGQVWQTLARYQAE